MYMNDKFSLVIQSFMMNEINLMIKKYSSIELDKIEKIEQLFEKINDSELKNELLKDFNKTLELATDIDYSNVDNYQINLFLWIKNNLELDISIKDVIIYSEDLEVEGYVLVDDNSIIYKKGCDLNDLAREKLESMLDEERFIDKLLDKDSLVEYWMNGTSKNEVIRELVNSIEVEELLDFNSQLIIEDNNGEEYMYAEMDC